MGRIIKNGLVYGGCTFGFQPIIYSTEEREVGVWKDGKPLYKKTLLPSVTSTSFTVNISALSVDTMVDIDAFIPQTSGNVVYIPYCTSTADYALCYYNNNYLKFAYAGSYNSTTWNITIYYTKTTDTAGSGTWTPQGIPAVHYSTSEQIVGTWIDSSTLYEKTIDFGALPNNTIKEVNHNITNINHIWIADGFAEDPVTGFTNQLNLSGTSNINSQWYFVVNKTFIRCVTNSDRTAYSVCYVTLRYTKSSS